MPWKSWRLNLPFAMATLAAATGAEVYYQSLLRYIGCNAQTHVMAAMFGDEISFRRDFALIDPARAGEMVGLIFSYLRRANANASLFGFIGGVAHGLMASKDVAAEGLSSHCEVAQRFAERLGFGESVAYPACAKIIVRAFPEDRRGFANAMVDAGLESRTGQQFADAQNQTRKRQRQCDGTRGRRVIQLGSKTATKQN